MAYLTFDFWETVIDITGLCLCGITVICLIIIKFKSNKSVREYAKKGNPGMFNDALIFQLLKQQSGKSFDAIIDTINKERRVLKELVEDPKNENGSKSFSLELKKQAGNEPLTGRHEEVIRLVDLGLKAGEISKKTKIPKGEIELIIKLKKNKHNEEVPTPLHLRHTASSRQSAKME